MTKEKEQNLIHAGLMTGTVVSIVGCSIGTVFLIGMALDLGGQLSGNQFRNESVDALFKLLQLTGGLGILLGPAYVLVQFKQGLSGSLNKICAGISFIAGFGLFMVGFQQIRITSIKGGLKILMESLEAAGSETSVVMGKITGIMAPLSVSQAMIPVMLTLLLSARFTAERWGDKTQTRIKK
ncbi:hypothetical protein N9B94_01555 [Verrucomicrobia bacterium]|nr:hypothetical protein [Verrucomicrobiota bacterium]